MQSIAKMYADICYFTTKVLCRLILLLRLFHVILTQVVAVGCFNGFDRLKTFCSFMSSSVQEILAVLSVCILIIKFVYKTSLFC